MRPELHLRPDRLVVHAAAAADVSEALLTALRGPGRPLCGGCSVECSGSAHGAELDRLDTALCRAIRELAELGAGLAAAVAAANLADGDAARALRHLGRS